MLIVMYPACSSLLLLVMDHQLLEVWSIQVGDHLPIGVSLEQLVDKHGLRFTGRAILLLACLGTYVKSECGYATH